MPIYKPNKYVPAQPSDINFKDLLSLKKMVIEVKNSFEYKNINAFVDSISVDDKLTTTIANFNIVGTNINDYNYISMMEAFLRELNTILFKKSKYSKFIFDIIGSWTQGKIVLFKK